LRRICPPRTSTAARRTRWSIPETAPDRRPFHPDAKTRSAQRRGHWAQPLAIAVSPHPGPSYGAPKSTPAKVVKPMTTDVPSSTPTSADRYVTVQNSDEFAGLRRALRSFVFPMTAVFFLWYALYVLLSAYARGFMGIKLIGNINVALVLGLLQFVSTFVIAWYYAKYADKRLDPIADKIRAELDGEGTK
jgi:uncharacterized membrane protein (DUF485 family)